MATLSDLEKVIAPMSINDLESLFAQMQTMTANQAQEDKVAQMQAEADQASLEAGQAIAAERAHLETMKATKASVKLAG